MQRFKITIKSNVFPKEQTYNTNAEMTKCKAGYYKFIL